MERNAQSITETYQALRPLILKDFGIGGAASRSSSGGGMEVHEISGVWHIGTLLESQAPWAATKSEWESALAAHAALPDVHHAAATAGTLITVTGQQVSLSVGSAQYQVPTTAASPYTPAWTGLSTFAGAGLSFTGGQFALQTPGTLAIASTNTASGSHTHAITSSSNPGAAASILASDAIGYLSLVRLTLTDRLRTPLIDTTSSYLTIQPSNSVTYFPAPGAIGLGTPTPARKFHIEDTTGAQMRLSYNLTNYMDFLVDSGGSWRIAPTGDIIVDPAGDDMRPLRNYAIRLGLDTSKYLSLHVAELIADTFVAEEVRSSIGGKIFVSPTTSLTRDLDAAALVYDTIAQKGTTTTALGSFTPAGYSTITQRGTTTTGTGTGGSGYETIAQRGTTTTNSAYTTNLSVSAPTGLSSGDVMVAIVIWWNYTLTPPSGWTQTGDTYSWSNSGETIYARAYYRVAGGSEPANYSWALNTIIDIAVAITAYDNVNTSDPIAAVGGQAQSSTSMTAPSISAATDTDMLVFLGAAGDTDAGDYTATPPSGMTERSDATSDQWVKTYVAHQLLTASGATGTRTATLSTSLQNAAFLVALRPAGGATGDTEVTVNRPTGTTDGDLLIARVSYTGGTLTTPSGWNEILTEAGTGVTLAVYQRTAASEPSTYTWTLDATNPMAVDTSAYYNVDTSDPIAAYDAQANSSSTSMVAPTITPGTTADMLLFAGAVAGNVRATAPSGMSEDADTGITGVGIYGADQLLASGSATGTRTATLASAAANVGALVSLRPIYIEASGASATIAPPTGTTTDDVMIATVAYTGGTLTPASGWTSVLAQAATGVSLAIYRRTAGGAEGNSVWSLNTADALAVAISAYDNIDIGAPLDIYSGQANASSTSMIAPSVSITSPSSRLIFAGAVAADVRATAPSGMGEDADTGQTGVGIYMADQALSSAGATGTRTATLASAAANAAALVALRPSSTPGGSTPTTIYTKHNNLNNGDRVILEARLQVEFMAVTSTYTEITPGEEYSYTVTRNLDGTGANSWIAGDAVVNLGQTGNGWIELYARYGMPRAGQGAYNRVGPTIVGNVRKSATFNDFREHWAIGNLNGLYDFSGNQYGAAFGDPTQTWISLDDRSHTLGGGLRFMNNLAEVGYIRNNATWRFNGNASNYIQWNGSQLEVRGTIVVTGTFSGLNYAGSSSAGGAANSITGQGALATANSAAWGSQVSGRPTELTDGRVATAIASGGILQSRFDPATNWGANPGPTVAGLLMGADYMGYWTGSAWRSYMDNVGRFYLNSGAANNYLSWNGTTLTVSGVINVLSGSNAALTDLSNSGISTLISGASIRVGSGTKDTTLNGWNIDSGEIVGQASGVDQVVLNTSGRITAGAGLLILDSAGLSLQSGTATTGRQISWYDSPASRTNKRAFLAVNEDPSAYRVELRGIGASGLYGEVQLQATNTSGAVSAWLRVDGQGTISLMGDVVVSDSADVGNVWTTLTLTSPWSNWGSGWATAQYCRFGDWVLIKGFVSPSSNQSAEVTILTLPAAIRPSENRRFGTFAGASATYLDVLSTGVVRVGGTVASNQAASIECMYKL